MLIGLYCPIISLTLSFCHHLGCLSVFQNIILTIIESEFNVSYSVFKCPFVEGMLICSEMVNQHTKGFCSFCKPDLLLQIEKEHYKDKSRTLSFGPLYIFSIYFTFCLIKDFISYCTLFCCFIEFSCSIKLKILRGSYSLKEKIENIKCRSVLGFIIWYLMLN